MSAFVVGRGDCSKSLLTCGIPDLELNLTSVRLQVFNFKIDAHCRQITWLLNKILFAKSLVCVSQHHTGFTN